jgi:hypothetical protein
LLHPLTLGALRRIIITRRNKMIGLCLSWLPPLAAAAAAPVGNLVRSNSKGGRKLLRGELREHEEHKAILSESLPTTTTRSTFFYFY